MASSAYARSINYVLVALCAHHRGGVGSSRHPPSSKSVAAAGYASLRGASRHPTNMARNIFILCSFLSHSGMRVHSSEGSVKRNFVNRGWIEGGRVTGGLAWRETGDSAAVTCVEFSLVQEAATGCAAMAVDRYQLCPIHCASVLPPFFRHGRLSRIAFRLNEESYRTRGGVVVGTLWSGPRHVTPGSRRGRVSGGPRRDPACPPAAANATVSGGGSRACAHYTQHSAPRPQKIRFPTGVAALCRLIGVGQRVARAPTSRSPQEEEEEGAKCTSPAWKY
ncbi:hypothetical protein MRX96_043156 [Rhipicephalus microplus]